jgi:histone deacetylase complex regulatory component SIN3
VSENSTSDPSLTEQLNQDLRSQIATLFADEPDLITGFDECIKQQHLKASEKYASECSFEERVKLRFADKPNKLAEFNSLLLNTGKQMLEDPSPQKYPQIWKETYSQMAAVLEGEPDLMEEFEVFYAKMQALGIQA